MTPCLAIHGGAGVIPAGSMSEEAAALRHEGLRRALRAGWRALDDGAAALDAVVAAVAALEDDPLFNAGHGSVFTDTGRLEMDAAVMEGRERRAGAVAGICGPRNPVRAARAIMETTPHVLMIGAGAEAAVRAAGLRFEPATYFETPGRRAALERELARRIAGLPDERDDDDRHGTVGAVARDADGHLAAATSTGGITGKRGGRVGDTAVIGAGTFAEDATCAISCTGTGEVFIRFTAAAEIDARIRLGGQTLLQAAVAVIAELAPRGGDGGLIAIGREGGPVFPFNCGGMYRGMVGIDGMLHTAIHREPFRTEALSLAEA